MLTIPEVQKIRRQVEGFIKYADSSIDAVKIVCHYIKINLAQRIDPNQLSEFIKFGEGIELDLKRNNSPYVQPNMFRTQLSPQTEIDLLTKFTEAVEKLLDDNCEKPLVSRTLGK